VFRDEGKREEQRGECRTQVFLYAFGRCLKKTLGVGSVKKEIGVATRFGPREKRKGGSVIDNRGACIPGGNLKTG